MNLPVQKDIEKRNNNSLIDKLPISELLNIIDFTKVEVDILISSSLMHTINNILSNIILNLSLLNVKFDIYKMQNDIQKGINPDFGFLVGQIINNYIGSEDLHDNKYYKNILKSIKLIEQNLHFSDEEKFNKNIFSIIDIEKYIYELVSNLEHNKKISKKSVINNGFYIKFESESYLGNTFNIEPIIINLISDLVHNSIKYSNEGVEVKVSIIQTINNIVLSVSDKGYGIKNEDINKVFEHGVRLDNFGDENGNGKGGYDCAYIVKKLGGQIYIKSEIGEGTEIKIILPN